MQAAEISTFLYLAIASMAGASRGTWNASGRYEYYASPATIEASYKSGLQFCEENDGTLALIKSDFVQKFVAEMVVDKKTNGIPYAFYIGLRDRWGNGTFVWDDGEPLDYTFWSTGEPNYLVETCTVVGKPNAYDGLKWKDIDCNSTSIPTGFLCQRLIGEHFGRWGKWSNCSCLMTQSRSRYCVDTGRSGPNTCAGIISETQTRTCVPVVECINVTEVEYTSVTSTGHPYSSISSTRFFMPTNDDCFVTVLTMAIVITILGLLLLGTAGTYLCKRCKSTSPSSCEVVSTEQPDPVYHNDMPLQNSADPLYVNARIASKPDQNEEYEIPIAFKDRVV